MKLPLVLLSELDVSAEERWQRQFVSSKRKYIEGIWRRTQDPLNKEKSGWKTVDDMRRKMVHYIDEFDVVQVGDRTVFQLEHPYLWVHYTFPESEVRILDARIEKALCAWTKNGNHYTLGDLTFSIDTEKPPLDTHRFPTFYRYRSYTLQGAKTPPLRKRKEPWEVLQTGIRKIPLREHPREISDIQEIKEYFPAHLELGCGPSIEAGVPPLHYLHDIFGITQRKTGKFLLDTKKDNVLPRLLTDPTSFYTKSSLPYQRALTAPITFFYKIIQELHAKGLIIDPVITNNFDGIPSLIGLKEKYVRRYSEAEIIPKIEFSSRARSLIVIGSHADRRRIQEAARTKGLKVIYVDPERFEEDGRKYPLEAPRDEDLLIHMTAREFGEKLKELFD